MKRRAFMSAVAALAVAPVVPVQAAENGVPESYRVWVGDQNGPFELNGEGLRLHYEEHLARERRLAYMKRLWATPEPLRSLLLGQKPIHHVEILRPTGDIAVGAITWVDEEHSFQNL